MYLLYPPTPDLHRKLLLFLINSEINTKSLSKCTLAFGSDQNIFLTRSNITKMSCGSQLFFVKIFSLINCV